MARNIAAPSTHSVAVPSGTASAAPVKTAYAATTQRNQGATQPFGKTAIAVTASTSATPVTSRPANAPLSAG